MDVPADTAGTQLAEPSCHLSGNRHTCCMLSRVFHVANGIRSRKYVQTVKYPSPRCLDAYGSLAYFSLKQV